MGIESATEQGVKTALKAYIDTLDPADKPAFRCFWLDDEENLDTEEREYPYIQIHAGPNVPSGHQSTFVDVPVEVKWATHKGNDPKKATVRSLYENCRTIIDAQTGLTVTGYSLIGVIIDTGGEAGVEENEQFITLPLTVKLCGA